MMIIPTI